MTSFKKAQALLVPVVGVMLLAGGQASYAKGCLKGAAVGAVAGHVAGHHAVVGAAAGCVIGHHMAKKKEQEKKAEAAREHNAAVADQGHATP